MKLNPARIARPNTSDDRRGPFQRGVGYTGWTKSLYTEVWLFDPGTGCGKHPGRRRIRVTEAARRWVNYVNGSDKAPAQWNYLLLSETAIAQCMESWAALKQLREE